MIHQNTQQPLIVFNYGEVVEFFVRPRNPFTRKQNVCIFVIYSTFSWYKLRTYEYVYMCVLVSLLEFGNSAFALPTI